MASSQQDEASSELRVPFVSQRGLQRFRARHVFARSRPCCWESCVLLGQGCASVSPSPQPPLASPRPSRMLRGQDPASSELGAQTSDLPGSESSLAQDGAPVPGQGAEALGRPSTAATPDPLSGSGRALSAAAAGRSFPGSINSQFSGLNSIARNRLQREFAGAPEAPLNYPDIHDDPAKIYHDRFGVEEEHDPLRVSMAHEPDLRGSLAAGREEPGRCLAEPVAAAG